MEEENQLLFLNSRNEMMGHDNGMHNRDDKKWLVRIYIPTIAVKNCGYIFGEI